MSKWSEAFFKWEQECIVHNNRNDKDPKKSFQKGWDSALENLKEKESNHSCVKKITLTQDYIDSFKNGTWKPSPNQIKQLCVLAEIELKRINEIRHILKKKENGVITVKHSEWKANVSKYSEMLDTHLGVQVVDDVTGKQRAYSTNAEPDIYDYDEYWQIKDLI